MKMQLIEVPAGSVLIQASDFDELANTINLMLNMFVALRVAFPKDHDHFLTDDQIEIIGQIDALLKRAENTSKGASIELPRQGLDG